VSCGLLEAERHDPNAKVVQAGLRQEADRMIVEIGKARQALLPQ